MRMTCEFVANMGGAEMKVLAATLISLSLFAAAASQAQTGAAQADASPTASAQDSHSIRITRSGSQQPGKDFTGSVQVEPLFSAHDPSRVQSLLLRHW